MAASATLRLFVGLPLRPEPAWDLEAWTRDHARGGWRRVPAANLHVTLVFLGATPEERLPAIGDALREACADVQAPAYVLGGLRRLGSVLAAVLEPHEPDGGAEQVARAQEVLARRLDRVESRPWLPHVTLARAGGTSRPRVPDSALPPLELDLAEVVLFASEPVVNGVRYRPLVSVPLKPPDLQSDAFDSHEYPSAAAPDARDGRRRGPADGGRGAQEGDAQPG